MVIFYLTPWVSLSVWLALGGPRDAVVSVRYARDGGYTWLKLDHISLRNVCFAARGRSALQGICSFNLRLRIIFHAVLCTQEAEISAAFSCSAVLLKSVACALEIRKGRLATDAAPRR